MKKRNSIYKSLRLFTMLVFIFAMSIVNIFTIFSKNTYDYNLEAGVPIYLDDIAFTNKVESRANNATFNVVNWLYGFGSNAFSSIDSESARDQILSYNNIADFEVDSSEGYCPTGDCNDNTFVNSEDPNTLEYDNMISLFHSSMVREADGTVRVWGQGISNSGGNIAPPQNLDNINYPALTGKILKMAGGSKAATSGGEQFAVLTTDGLFIWGSSGNLVVTGIKNNKTLSRVSIGTFGVNNSGNSSYSKGLPFGVEPKDVKMLFGSYLTLAITTCDGRVFVLSGQGNKNGNGQDNTNLWNQVKKSSDSNDFLTNVVATRGTSNALMALTDDGKIYTWGNDTYINNGNGSSRRIYATEVSLPGEVTPKMIGMTQSSASNQTYYLLTTDGDLFAMGANDKKQLGRGNTSASNTWTLPQKVTDQNEQGAGDLKDIAWISPNEHDNAGHAAINVLTKDGKLWAWGSNNGMMIGAPDVGTSYDNYDPIYMPGKTQGNIAQGKLNLTDVLMAVETGGHTTIAVKQCSKKFGYVGHKVSGSMGDNTASSGHPNTYDFENTVDLVVCGAATTPMVEDVLMICEGETTDLTTALVSEAPNGFSIEWWTTPDRKEGTHVTDPTDVGEGTYYAFYIPDNDGLCSDPDAAKVLVEPYGPDDPEYAQCHNYCPTGDCNDNAFLNTSDPNTLEYDNFISGFHSSIIKQTDGNFLIYGQNANASSTSGDANLYKPTLVHPDNGFEYEGTPLKMALGSQGYYAPDRPSSNRLYDQYALLTTEGLYMWGSGYGGIYDGIIIHNSIKTSFPIEKITSKHITNANEYGLPSGVDPENVKMLFGTYSALVITTCTGEAWVLSWQGRKNGDGTIDDINNRKMWHRVKTDESGNPYLTGVVAVRGHQNALMALTSSGEIYTWGEETYLGNGTKIASRVYATKMTLPTLPAGVAPKMIGLTRNGFTASNPKTGSTYYLLTTDGQLFSLGNNEDLQLGDFSPVSITEKTSWVNVKFNRTTNMSNIAWISPNEHTGKTHATVTALTTDGKLWGWGRNDGFMLGGNVNPTNSNPTFMFGGLDENDKILAVETGGHIVSIFKDCEYRLGYIGHEVFGSYGNDHKEAFNNSFQFNGAAFENLCSIELPPIVKVEEKVFICEGETFDLTDALIGFLPDDVIWYYDEDLTSPVEDFTSVGAGKYYVQKVGVQCPNTHSLTIVEYYKEGEGDCYRPDCPTGDCNDNTFIYSYDPNTIEYDNIVSTFHSTIVREADGRVKVWGQAIGNNSTSDENLHHVLTPQYLNKDNYPELTGNILKFAAGSISSEKGGAQFAVLTTDGLFIWGDPFYLVSGKIKPEYEYKLSKVKIATYGEVEISDKGLPNGVEPTDVKMLFGTHRTLVITTCNGEVWVLSRLGAKNGDGSTEEDTSEWHRVKTSDGKPLKNIVATRGTENALFALSASGKIYTWGTGTYLGDRSIATNRAYATEMTLPTGVTPKMIGMTQSIDNQTYYLLATDGKLFALGANEHRQLGDGTTDTRTTWEQPQKPASQGGGAFDNVVWISPNEHDGSGHAAINVITVDQKLWGWGMNHGGMLGTGDEESIDKASDPIYMPGELGDEDKMLAVETGGHTTMVIKDCTNRFGYTGHRVNGSMADGTADNKYEPSYNFEETAIINVCGAITAPVLATSNLKICGGSFADLNDALYTDDINKDDYVWYAAENWKSKLELSDITAVDKGTYYVVNVKSSCPEAYSVVLVEYLKLGEEGYENCVSPNSTHAVDDFYETGKNTSVSGNVMDNDYDSEGDIQIITKAGKNSDNLIDITDGGTITFETVNGGKVTIYSNGNFTYTPPVGGFSGFDIFEYQVCDDADPRACDIAEVEIGVGICIEEVNGEYFKWSNTEPGDAIKEGNTLTKLIDQPATTYGFIFDIYDLDNSFNMEINGIKLAEKEIEFQKSGPGGQNIRFQDGTIWEEGGIEDIWKLNGDKDFPIVRVVISPTGKVAMYGSKTSKGELHRLVLFNGNKFNVFPFNVKTSDAVKNVENNKIKVTQNMIGTTEIEGYGYGANIAECPNYWYGNEGTDWDNFSNWTDNYVPEQITEDVEFATKDNNSNKILGISGSGSGKGPAVDDLYVPSGDTKEIKDLINETKDVVGESEVKSLVIPPNSGLIIHGETKGSATDPNKIVVKASENESTGTLIFKDPDKNKDVQATVEFYNQAYDCKDCGYFTRSWQYFGIPVQSAEFPYLTPQMETINEWMENVDGNKWVPVTTDLKAFRGYEMTNSSKDKPTHIYEFKGKLNVGYATVALTKSPAVNYSGMNLIANSFTAAIPINSDAIKYSDTNWDGNLYLFNTGTRDQWRKLNGGSTPGVVGGTYTSVPTNVAGEGGLPTSIPSMHTFMVNAPSTGSMALAYDKLVKNEVKDGQPAWRSVGQEQQQEIPHIVLDVIGTQSADRVWLFEQPGTTRGFDNGWDGMKMPETDIVQLYVAGEEGANENYQVATVPQLVGTSFGMTPEMNESYTLSMAVSQDVEARGLYLRDMLTGRSYALKSGAEYRVSGSQSSDNRFKVVDNTLDESKLGDNALIDIYTQDSQVVVANNSEEDCTVSLYDVAGKLVAKQTVARDSTTYINGRIGGAYVVKVMGSKEVNESKRVLVK